MNLQPVRPTVLFAAILCAGLAGLQPATAKPGWTKQCSHFPVSVNVSGSPLAINKLKQKAIVLWQSQTGAKVQHAIQKQFSCIPAPKIAHCTFSAKPCTYKKNTGFGPTPPPKLPRPGFGAARGG